MEVACPRCAADLEVTSSDVGRFDIECPECGYLLDDNEIVEDDGERPREFDIECEACGEEMIARLRDLGRLDLMCPSCDVVVLPQSTSGEPMTAREIASCRRLANKHGTSFQEVIRRWLTRSFEAETTRDLEPQPRFSPKPPSHPGVPIRAKWWFLVALAAAAAFAGYKVGTEGKESFDRGFHHGYDEGRDAMGRDVRSECWDITDPGCEGQCVEAVEDARR